MCLMIRAFLLLSRGAYRVLVIRRVVPLLQKYLEGLQLQTAYTREIRQLLLLLLRRFNPQFQSQQVHTTCLADQSTAVKSELKVRAERISKFRSRPKHRTGSATPD